MMKYDLLLTCCVRSTKNREANMLHNDRALCRCGIRIPSARTNTRLLIKINVQNQCLAMLVMPEPKLLCCYCRLLQLQAALAQNPLLCAVLPRFRSFCFSISVNKCGVNKTVDISKYQFLHEFKNELSKITRFLKWLISVNISF